MCGEALRAIRERTGVSQSAFAEMCGWRPQYQHHLERTPNVTVGEKDRETVVRIDSEEAVELAIYKWGDANTVQVCNQLKDLLGFEREYSLMERVVKSFQKAARIR